MTLNPAVPERLAEQSEADEQDRASRSFARQAVVDTLSRPTAWFGLVWIGLLVLAAVFAPFIASSFPLLAKENGHWRSPVLVHMVPADVIWLAGFFTAATLLLMRPTSFPRSVAVLMWIVALMIPLTLWPAVVRDHWLPGGDALGKKFGWTVLILAMTVDLAILIGLPLLVRGQRTLKIIVALLALPVVVLMLVFRVNPPEAVVYEEYRVKETSA